MCWGPAARYQLQRWGFALGSGKPVPVLALAASMMGSVTDGKWKSAQLDSPFALAELLAEGEDDNAFAEPVLEALKNILPAAPDTTQSQPATQG